MFTVHDDSFSQPRVRAKCSLPIDVEVPTSESLVKIVGHMAEQSMDTSEPVPKNQQSQLDKCIEENNFTFGKKVQIIGIHTDSTEGESRYFGNVSDGDYWIQCEFASKYRYFFNGNKLDGRVIRIFGHSGSCYNNSIKILEFQSLTTTEKIGDPLPFSADKVESYRRLIPTFDFDDLLNLSNSSSSNDRFCSFIPLIFQ